MREREFYKIRLYFTAITTAAIWVLLIWDHFHYGVPSHHILQNEDLPKFSNWLGGILIPLLTWFLLYRIQKRIRNNSTISKFPVNIFYAFIAALSFGLLLSVFFTLGYSEIPFYMIVSLLVLAIFLPIYKAECFLGFVLGMTFTFGGVLPIGIISILSLIGAVLYLIVKPGIQFIITKTSYFISSKKNT
ncbi:hypothetical protein K5V07_08670 [Flavobacterium sp. CHNK8]|uniref:hypothetical protein n=1 Tax=Flavobacterium sp. CHNK8 TaxID=2871165 RepID=UPI001C8D3D1D|nr:hypothetical protein [Flavobacterium sp. CHNK8]QZK90561.1 hypothetical protein K5V07_08670 [Flavobacterium sp. CHNK8]